MDVHNSRWLHTLIEWNTNQLYFAKAFLDTNLSPNPRTQNAWHARNMLGKYINEHLMWKTRNILEDCYIIYPNIHKTCGDKHEMYGHDVLFHKNDLFLPLEIFCSPGHETTVTFQRHETKVVNKSHDQTTVAHHLRPMVFNLSSKKSASRIQKKQLQ